MYAKPPTQIVYESVEEELKHSLASDSKTSNLNLAGSRQQTQTTSLGLTTSSAIAHGSKAKSNDKPQVRAQERHRRSRAPSPDEARAAYQQEYCLHHSVSSLAQHALQMLDQLLKERTHIDFEEELRTDGELTWRLRGYGTKHFSITQTFVAEDADIIIATMIIYIDEVAENKEVLPWAAWKAEITKGVLLSAKSSGENVGQALLQKSPA